MPPVSIAAIAQANVDSHRTTSSLTRRYGGILIVVALLVVLDQAVLQPRLLDLSLYAPRINLAGRQRMLSQRLVKAGLALEAASSPSSRDRWRSEFVDTLALWRSSHRSLVDGSRELGLPPTKSREILAAFARLQPHFQSMVLHASALATGEGFAVHGPELLEQESLYLPQMDRIVGLYESEARQQAQMLRVLGLGAAVSIVALLVALGHWVLRPAVHTIRKQMESLEVRVAQRTSALTRLNQSLQHEVRERRQAEHRTRELSLQLAHSSRVLSMGQLALGLAHEVNQPLAAIANYAETCTIHLEAETSDRTRLGPLVSNIRSAALRAGEIVRGMRDFLRPGQTPKTSVSVNQLVQEVLRFCQLEFVRGHVQLELDLCDEPTGVEVASIQIQQVLINLLQNAIQALELRPPDDRIITIRTRLEADHFLIEVEDSGLGFGDRDPESLFEAFYTTKPGGLGMGLAIARNIVREHAGRLWAENRACGAAVCFTLPLETQHERNSAVIADCVCG